MQKDITESRGVVTKMKLGKINSIWVEGDLMLWLDESGELNCMPAMLTGLRKVLGASVGSIFTLLSKDFLLLVILSLVIAFPIAYRIMHGWLQNFDYRIDISWYIFVAAALLALLVAFATVSFQAIRAARANPVRSLRVK